MKQNSALRALSIIKYPKTQALKEQNLRAAASLPHSKTSFATETNYDLGHIGMHFLRGVQALG